jgi:hypothetical protein
MTIGGQLEQIVHKTPFQPMVGVGACLSSKGFFDGCNKIPEENNLKEERFILSQRFRGFGLWSAVSIALGLSQSKILSIWRRPLMEEAAYLMVARKQKETERKGSGTTYTLQNHNFSDLLLT